MLELETKNLGRFGATYLRSRLEVGGALCKKLLQAGVQFEDAYAPLPRELDRTRLTNLDEGGLTTQRATLEWLLQEISRRLPVGEDRCVIFEDSWSRESDYPDIGQGGIAKFGGSVVMVLSESELDMPNLVRCLRSLRAFEYSMIAASCSRSDLVLAGMTLAEKVIERVVLTSQMVLVSAFDREGVVAANPYFARG